MKAPDKIYCGNNGHGNLSYSSVKVYDTMSEYIRKDALLEWAKEIKKQEEGLEKAGYGRVFYGARIAIIDEVINKINSI